VRPSKRWELRGESKIRCSRGGRKKRLRYKTATCITRRVAERKGTVRLARGLVLDHREKTIRAEA